MKTLFDVYKEIKEDNIVYYGRRIFIVASESGDFLIDESFFEVEGSCIVRKCCCKNKREFKELFIYEEKTGSYRISISCYADYCIIYYYLKSFVLFEAIKTEDLKKICLKAVERYLEDFNKNLCHRVSLLRFAEKFCRKYCNFED